jgi:hypothetical protein
LKTWSSKGFANRIKGRAFKNAVLKVPKELWQMTLYELLLKFNPTKVDCAIKERFWTYIHSTPDLKPIDLSSLYKDICTYTNLYNHFLSNPTKIVWLLTLDDDNKSRLNSVETDLLKKLEQILLLQIYDEKGRPNHKSIDQVIRATALIYGVLIEL